MTQWRDSAATILLLAVLATSASCGGDEAGDDSAASARPRSPEQLSVVSQNLLHGYDCPDDTDGCLLGARIDLFTHQLDEECPDLVGLQEMNQDMVSQIEGGLPSICDGGYTVVGGDAAGLDSEVVLSTLPVLAQERFRLAGPVRTALWVRVAADVGVVDLWTTHLASSSDDGPCTSAACPPPCSADDTLNSCQARQIIELAEDRRVEGGVVVIAGDLNAEPDEPTIAALLLAGYLDSHLEAGNAECDPATGDECTSGRNDESMVDLTDPTSQQMERIDYVFVSAPERCGITEGTGLFRPEPAEAAATGSSSTDSTSTPPAAGAVFASDHTGVVAVIECETTSAEREAAKEATVPTSASTTTVAAGTLDPATEAAITQAFTTVFGGGGGTVDEKLLSLEDPAAVGDLYRSMYAQTSEMADRITVRIDALAPLGDGSTAAVTFSLLLDGNTVVDHLEGTAVLVDGQWRVSTDTFCQLAVTGATEVPPACA